jgi:hypothetical protein
MSSDIRLRIGDLFLALVPAEPDCQFQIEDHYEPFAVGDGLPNAVLRVHCGRIPDLALGQKIFDTGLGWRLYRSNGKWIIYVRSAGLDPYQLAVFEPDFHAGDIYLKPHGAHPGRIPFPLAYPLGKVFMINLLSRGYGLLLHACGVKDGGKGLLFVGTSGVGKSTMTRLWANRSNVTLLGDDNIILGERNGRLWIYGTPWPGEAGVFSPDAARLEQVFVLRQSGENRAVPLRPLDAASRLLVRCFPTFWDAEGMEYTAALLSRLAQAVPCYELGFRPEPAIVDLVRSLNSRAGRVSPVP